jgi:hypothetical protein
MQKLIKSIFLLVLASLLLFSNIEAPSYIVNWKKSYNDTISYISLSGNGQELVVAWNNKTEVLNAFSETIFTYSFPSKLNIAKISNNTNYMVACISNACYLFKRGPTTYSLVKSVNFTSTVNDMDLSYDGSVIAIVTNDNKLHLLNSSGNYITSPKVTSGTPIRLVISGNSKFILIGMINNKISFYDNKGNLQWNKTLSASVKDMDISYKGDFMALGTSDNKVYFLYYDGTIIWNKNVTGLPYVISIDDLSKYVVVGTLSNYLYLYDNLGNLKYTEIFLNPINSLKISSNGKYFAVLDNGGNLYYYDENGSKLWTYRLSDLGKRLDLSYDGKIVIAFSQDNKVYYLTNIGEATITQTMTKTYTLVSNVTYTTYKNSTITKTYTATTTSISNVTYLFTVTATRSITKTTTENITYTTTVVQPLYENLTLVAVFVSIGIIFGIGLGYAISRLRRSYY